MSQIPGAPPSQPTKIDMMTLLKGIVDQKASDLHISVGNTPGLRVHGRLVRVKGNPLSPAESKELCFSVMTDSQKMMFERDLEIDFSFGVKDLARFRANVFVQRGAVCGVFRKIPTEIPEFDSLKLPQILKDVIHRPNGLVLVTGATGSGKSTSIAAMLDLLNRTEFGHILTVEDPIEFVHQHKNCFVTQREVGSDTKSFKRAIKRILRQDPDFILVGELRDTETMAMALTLAETGHLVFGTLHTNSAVQAINRVLNFFPPHQQPQVRQELSFVLQAVFTQQLVPKSGGQGIVMASELLIPTVAIRSLIRQDKIHQIYSGMQTGQEATSMYTMNQSLFEHVKSGMITPEDAIEYSVAPEELEKMLGIAPQKGVQAPNS